MILEKKLDWKNNLSIDSIKHFEKINALEKLNDAKTITIFGAGGGGRYLKKVLDELNIKGYYFYDNDKSKWEKNIDGIKILPPSNLALFDKNSNLVCIASNWARDIAQQLREMGTRNYVDLTYWDNRWRKGYDCEKILSNLNKIKEVYNSIEDRKSKNTYLSIIKYRMSMDPIELSISSYEQYFCPIVKPEKNDVIIDAGAWIGDTAIQFCKYLKNKCKIFSFEPDKNNYNDMEKNIEKKNLKNCIIPIEVGLWNKDTELRYSTQENNSMQYRIDVDGDFLVKVISLDSFIKENNIIPSLIKMDIEGAEYEAIKGAAKTIKRYGPKLQICLYHNIEDIWRLPLLIKKINSNYMFYIGHHSQNLPETVLYAKLKNKSTIL